MGVLRFDGADWVRFSTLATPLANTSDGAWTAAVLFKQATDSGFQAYTYLNSAGPVAEAGFSRNATGDLFVDVGGTSSGIDIVGTTVTYIAVAKKAAGSADPTFQLYNRTTTTWSSPTTTGTNIADQIAATILEIGTWQGGSDMADAWIGLVGWWEGAMSQANVETLDNNWQTSDWYNNAHGTPTALIECNVAASSLVDLTGNATNRSVTGTPTLDAGETLSSFNFNGTGAAAVVADRQRGRVFPIRLARFRGPSGLFLPFPLPDFGPAVGGITYAKAGELVVGVQTYGADVFTAAETGSLTTGVVTAGGRNVDRSRLGSITTAVQVYGADVATYAETGSLTVGVLAQGADVFTAAETGSLTAGTLAAGADAFTAVESGSLTPDTSLSGADATTFAETGSITTGAVVSGADAVTFVEAGTVMTNALVSGVSSTVAGAVNVKAGSVTAGALISGTDSFQPSETGSITAGALLAGTDAHTATKAGSLIAGTVLTGADSVTYVETGALLTRVFLAGIGTTVVPLPWMEASATATSTLEGAAGATDLAGGFTATSVLEGAAKATSFEAGFTATGGNEA